MPPWGGAPYFKCVEQETESVFGRLLVDAQQLEDLLTVLRVVNSDRAAARFAAVDDQVIGLGAAILGVVVQQRQDRWPAGR